MNKNYDDIVKILEGQAKLTAYYNGQGREDAISYNHPGRFRWWDYVTDEAKAFILDVTETECCKRHTNERT